MTKRVVGGVVACAVIAVLAWWLWSRGHDAPASAGLGSSTSGSAAGVARAAGAPVVGTAQAHVTVTVRDSAGTLAGAIVRIVGDEGDDAIVLRTGADGSVRSPDLAAGSVRISASADGHQPAGVARDLAAGDDARVELVLASGGATLSGAVTDMTGGPVAGARVDAAVRGAFGAAPLAVATALTGADGRYHLTIAPATVNVAVRSADYAPQSRFVVVPAKGATADFALVPGAAIEGIVRDRVSREPVAGARVIAAHDGAAVALAETATREVDAGADGKFRIAGLRPGGYVLRANAGERTSVSPTKLGVAVAEQVTGVEILVGTGAVVRGTVRDEADAPVAGADVSTFGDGGGAQAKSAADGTFALVGLAPGRWAAMASGAGYVPAGTAQFELASHDVAGVDVHVRRGSKLVGHVEPRQPCEVRLELDDGALAMGTMPMLLAPVEAGSDGAFELGPASPGKATLTARCPSGDEGSLPVNAPATGELVIHVTPGASVAGTVVDTTGQPVTGVTVAAAAITGVQHTVIVNGAVTSGAQAITDDHGAYEVRGLYAGDYALSVLDRGRPLAAHGNHAVQVTVAATEHKTGVELAIERADGTIDGVVTGPDGSPVADAWVSASQDLASILASVTGAAGMGGGSGDAGSATSSSRTIMMQNDGDDGGGFGGLGGDFAPALTDASGHFQLTGLPHVSLDVVAEAQGGALRAAARGVTPSTTANLQLSGLTAIAGVVHGPSGPPALYTISLVGPTLASRGFAAPDGSFEIDRIDPGDYQVSVASSDGNAEAAVHVAAGQTAHVDLTLAANAVVVGKVVDHAGAPVGGVPVVVAPDSGGGRLQITMDGPPRTTAPDGTFRLEAKPGPTNLIVLAQPVVTRRGLALVAGQTLDVGAVALAAP